MRYRVLSGSVGHGVAVVDPGGEIDLTPEQAASLTERGCALAPIVDSPPPAGQAEAPAEPEAGDGGAGDDDSPEPAHEPDGDPAAAPEAKPKPKPRSSRRGA